jgi:hypothetical protein
MPLNSSTKSKWYPMNVTSNMETFAQLKDLKLFKKISAKAKITDEKNFHTTLELCLRNQYMKSHKKISKTNYSISKVTNDSSSNFKANARNNDLKKGKKVEYSAVRENIEHTNKIMSHNFRKSFYSTKGKKFHLLYRKQRCSVFHIRK